MTSIDTRRRDATPESSHDEHVGRDEERRLPAVRLIA